MCCVLRCCCSRDAPCSCCFECGCVCGAQLRAARGVVVVSIAVPAACGLPNTDGRRQLLLPQLVQYCFSCNICNTACLRPSTRRHAPPKPMSRYACVHYPEYINTNFWPHQPRLVACCCPRSRLRIIPLRFRPHTCPLRPALARVLRCRGRAALWVTLRWN